MSPKTGGVRGSVRRGVSGARGGPWRHPVGHSLAHPVFGDTLGTLRARETPVAGSQNSGPTCKKEAWKRGLLGKGSLQTQVSSHSRDLCILETLKSLQNVNTRILGRHVCRTKLPPKIIETDTKNSLKNAKNDPKNDAKRVRKMLSPSQAALKFLTGTFLEVFHSPKFAK